MVDVDEVRARLTPVLGDTFDLSRRDDRWLALSADRVAFAAGDEGEWARLSSEARLLDRWRRAGAPVPRVLDENPRVRVQIRERLDGVMGEIVEPLLFGSATLADLGRSSPLTRAGAPLPWAVPDGERRLDARCPLSPFGARLAHSYGELAARLHSLSLDDARAAGITERPPMDLHAAVDRLRATSIDRSLVAKAERAIAWLAEVPPPSCVVHGDLHFHNMCLAEDGSIIGVFDIGDAHLDAPESEFHYVHSLGPRFVEIAMAAYGAPLDEGQIRRAHARTALGHLVFVAEDSPRWPAMLAWNTAVLRHLVPGKGAGT
ncbi:MAG: phosphotransferase [Kofleriaceae bacterium]